MKQRPIIFSTPMMQALLAGRKTQTRRIIKTDANDIQWMPIVINGYGGFCDEHGNPVKCPYGAIGDVLWVRETWKHKQFAGNRLDGFDYYADTVSWAQRNNIQITKGVGLESTDGAFIEKWRSPIFMPREACRIRLKITDIKVERVQDISEEDAIAEGAYFTDYGRTCYHNGMNGYIDNCPSDEQYHPQKRGLSMVATTSKDQCLETARTAFGNLFQKINGADSWDANPFVWCLTFEIVQP